MKKELRNFAFIWTGFFLIIALFPLIKGHNIRIWALYPAGFFGVIGLVLPLFLMPFYRVWIKFGNFMGKVNSTIIIFLMFAIIFVPIGIVMRLFGKDPLHKKISKDIPSYWVKRQEQPGSMKNQF